MRKEALGIDIGGVIIDRINDNTDTSFFSDNYLKTTPVPDAFMVIRDLVDHRFKERVCLVSKCGPNVEAKTLHWLHHHEFHKVTGMHAENVLFCRERHEKAPICEELGITHFIDDRLEVLGHLHSVKNRFLFMPRTEEMSRHAKHLHKVRLVNSWAEIRKILL